MKLIDILARKLKVWPEGLDCLSQLKGTGYIISGKGFDGRAFNSLEIADETKIAGAVVTRAEWQAAVEALAFMDKHEIAFGSEPGITAPSEWNGQYLPAVGMWLEAGFAFEDFKKWHKGVCIAVGECPEGREEFCVVRFGKKIAMYTVDGGRMRPIRTAEQIADEERVAGIMEIERVAKTGEHLDIPMRSATALWDAGYRKQVAK